MLHTIGCWRPSLAAFPDPRRRPRRGRCRRCARAIPPRTTEAAAARRAAADYARDYGLYDDEAIAAVDEFRVDRGLNYQGDAAGLVDARLIDALRAAYLAKKKTAANR